MKPEIYQIKSIGKGSLFAMAKPVADDFMEQQFVNLANEKINRIVSLMEIDEASKAGLEEELRLTEKHRMEFVSFPIRDRGMPDSITEFSKFTRGLYDDIASGLNTVVHCYAGIGRTGMVSAAVLLHDGFQPEQAFQHISLKRGVSVPDTQQQIDWIVNNRDTIVNLT